MKKKGFTLIELVVALAIFAIVIVAISNAFMTGVKIWKLGDIRLDGSSYAEGVIQVLKSKDTQLNVITPNDNTHSYYYIYFNDMTMMKNAMKNFILPGSKTSVYNAIDYDGAYGTEAVIKNSFNECKGKNNNNKTYGCYIDVYKDSSSGCYVIKSTVWNLQYGAQSEAKREVYVSW